MAEAGWQKAERRKKGMKQEDPWRSRQSRRSAKKVQRVRPEHFPAAKGNGGGGGGGRLAFHPSPSKQRSKREASQPAQPSQASIDSTAQPSRMYERRSSQAWSSLVRTRPSVSRPSWWFNLRSPSSRLACGCCCLTCGHGWLDVDPWLAGWSVLQRRGSSDGAARARRHWAVNAPTSHRGLGAGRLMM